jgi:hypothetical protein
MAKLPSQQGTGKVATTERRQRRVLRCLDWRVEGLEKMQKEGSVSHTWLVARRRRVSEREWRIVDYMAS